MDVFCIWFDQFSICKPVLEKILAELTETINGLKLDVMPPPAQYHGYGNMNDFVCQRYLSL